MESPPQADAPRRRSEHGVGRCRGAILALLAAGAAGCRSRPASSDDADASRAGAHPELGVTVPADQRPSGLGAPTSSQVPGGLEDETVGVEPATTGPEEPKPGGEHPQFRDYTPPSGDAQPGVAPTAGPPGVTEEGDVDAPGPGAGKPPVPNAIAETEWGIGGSFTAYWKGRKSGDAKDQDVYGVLALDTSRDRISAHVLARVSADVDGTGDAQSQATFGSLQDTYDDHYHLDLYEASVEVDRPFDASGKLRVGRQIDYATPEYAHFDGVRVETAPIGDAKVVGGAYGGIPVRIYDATSVADRIFGAFGETRPWEGGRVRADWMHVDQDGGDQVGYHDDLLALALWQRIGTHVMVDAAYSYLEGESRDVRMRATYDDGEGDLNVQVGYYRLLTPQKDFAYEFDPFYATLSEYQPYGQYRLIVSKALMEHLRLDVGGDLRTLEDDGDESTQNHEYARGYGTLVFTDVFADGLDFSLTGDTWNSDDQDVRTWGADVTWRPDDVWRASAGSGYALYKYDVAQDVERDDIRLWYARVRRNMGEAWTADLGYEYEDDDFDDYHEIRAGVTWHF